MLVYSMGVSVDGFINDRAGGFAWTVPDEDEFLLHNTLVGGLGTYLCGHRLYETMLRWETDPSMRSNEVQTAFADTIGGATLAAQAIDLGLVDELQLFRHPVIVGGGTPHLPAVTGDVPLVLRETKAFGSGILYERYGREPGEPAARP